MNTYQNENIKSDIFWMQKMVRAISSKEKKVFLITFFTILLARGFRLANYMPNHDTLWNFCAPQDVITSGRWSLVWAAGISSNYDLQWLNGVISILYIAMTNIVIIRMFQIKNMLLSCSFGVLLGVYPSVVSTFMYMYTADAYYLAMLLSSVAAMLILSSRWRRRLAGSVLLGFSIGIYQAYLSVALVLCVLWLIQHLIMERKSIRIPLFNALYSTLLGGAFIPGCCIPGCMDESYALCIRIAEGVEQVEG